MLMTVHLRKDVHVKARSVHHSLLYSPVSLLKISNRRYLKHSRFDKFNHIIVLREIVLEWRSCHTNSSLGLNLLQFLESFVRRLLQGSMGFVKNQDVWLVILDDFITNTQKVNFAQKQQPSTISPPPKFAFLISFLQTSKITDNKRLVEISSPLLNFALPVGQCVSRYNKQHHVEERFLLKSFSR